MTTMLGEYIKELVEQQECDNRIAQLVAMPEWEFVIVMGEGFFDTCAGTTRNGIYYSEYELLIAYHQRNPDAEPLV